MDRWNWIFETFFFLADANRSIKNKSCKRQHRICCKNQVESTLCLTVYAETFQRLKIAAKGLTRHIANCTYEIFKRRNLAHQDRTRWLSFILNWMWVLCLFTYVGRHLYLFTPRWENGVKKCKTLEISSESKQHF